jgi:hypothetical protein
VQFMKMAAGLKMDENLSFTLFSDL